MTPPCAFGLHLDAFEAVCRSIVISGPCRTGSTLTGRMVHSFSGVEYVYEPPLMFSLMPLVAKLDRPVFQRLFETYFYEDLMLGQVTGRAWNFNEHEDSCIRHVKSAAEVEARLGERWTKARAVESARAARFCIKVPEMAPHLIALREMYPGLSVVITHREAAGCIASLVQKKWFSDEVLREGAVVWDRRTVGGLALPSWVREEDAPRWPGFSELERAALYYVTNSAACRGLPGAVVFSYERLLRDPAGEVAGLARALGVPESAMTARLVAGVRPPRAPERDVLAALPRERRAEVERYSDLEYFRSSVQENACPRS